MIQKRPGQVPASVNKKHELSTLPPPAELVSVIVTGFGRFHDVPTNPTTTITEKLVPYLKTREDAGLHRVSNLLSSNVRTVVIETSAEAARQSIDELYDELCANIVDSPSESSTIVLHLGVNTKGTKFQLECCAYNEATFRIPDERGYQPLQASILDHWDLSAPLSTNFDVKALVSILSEEDTRPSIEGRTVDSTDPGRFVCNFTYFLSLDKCHEGKITLHGKRIQCLFLHVPPFEVIPEEDQLDFVARLLEHLATMRYSRH